MILYCSMFRGKLVLNYVKFIPCLILMLAKIYDSRKDLEILLSLNVWEYVKSEVD